VSALLTFLTTALSGTRSIKRLVDNLQSKGDIHKISASNDYPIVEDVRMSLTGSIIDIDFNESKFDQFSFILDEIFQKETNHKYNLTKQINKSDCYWMMLKKLGIQLLGLPKNLTER